VSATGNAYYPDASVVCGRLEIEPEDGLSMLNPSVLVEVLSRNTAEYDRTDKLTDYQRIGALEHIVHLGYDAPEVIVWTRTTEGWQRRRFGAGEIAELEGVDCRLDVSELYRDPLSAT